MNPRLELITFISKELARDRADVDVTRDSLVETGIIDSVGIMKLVAFLEQRFGKKIGDEELLPENFETVDAIVALLNSK